MPPVQRSKEKARILDFSLLIILNLDIHTGTTWTTDNGLLFNA